MKTIIFLLAAVGLHAQTLNVDKTTLSLSALYQGTAVSQTVNVTASSGVIAFVTSTSTQSCGNWLKVNATSAVTPATLTVTADPTALLPGVCQGIVSLRGSNPIDIPVTFTVGALSVNLSTVTWTYQLGAAAPQSVPINVNSAQPLVVNTTVTSDGNWLQVQPFTTAPGTAVLSANQTALLALQPGPHSGTLTITPTSGPSTTPVTVSVSLTVSAVPPVTITPQAVSLAYQFGTSTPAQQTFTISQTGNQAISFSTVSTAAANPVGGVWYTVTPSGGTIPPNGSVTVTVAYAPNSNPALNLPPGSYSGQIIVGTPSGTPTSTNVNVGILVSTAPVITPAPSSLNFNWQTGAQTPAAQNVAISSSSSTGTLPLTLSATTNNGGSWISLPATTANTGTAFAVAVNPTGLQPGTYTGAVSVSSTGAGNSPVSIPVSLTVTNNPVLVALVNGCSTAINGNCALTFADQINQTPPIVQNLKLTSSTGAALNYSITAIYSTAANNSACGVTWLQAGATGTTDASIPISVNPANIPAGTTCNATLSIASTVASSGALVPNSPLSIPVTLYVSSTPLLLVDQYALLFSAPVNGNSPAIQKITLTSTSASDQLKYSVTSSTTSGGNSWLFLPSAQNGTTAPGGSPVSISVFQGSLSPGSYSGTITVTATDSSGNTVADTPVTIPVTLVVTAGSLSVSPTSLSFSQAAGAAASAPQTINVTNSIAGQNQNYTIATSVTTTSNSVNWLSATPSSGTTPGTVSVTADGSKLPAGTYNGAVTISPTTTAGGSPVTIPVTLTVLTGQTIAVSPTSLSFSFVAGGSAPASQTLQLTTTGSAIPFSAAATTSNSGSWLGVTPASGTTPGTLTVSVNPQGLTASSTPYTGTITITSPNLATPVTVAVSLTVSTIPTPVVTAIGNAASYATGSISPGENIVIFGTGIGPSALAPGVVTSAGKFDVTAGQTQVTFDGVPAPMIYASATQTSVMVPYGIFGRQATTIRVSYQGVLSAPLIYNVSTAAPGIYTLNQSGTGPGAILNQDYSVNGSATPAAKNSVVQIYMTGEGETNTVPTDGALAPTNGTGLFHPQLPVTATVGGVPATVQYAGSAPGIVYGVMQVNVTIPASVSSGPQPVVITLGTATTQGGVTVSVQ